MKVATARVKIEKSMDDIRDNVSSEMKRDHLLTQQDIRRQYNIEGIERHHNDYTSILTWVEELRSLPYNPVVLFKQQEEQEEDMNDIGTDDFVLGLQTEFQREMMKQYGNNIIITCRHYSRD